MKDFLRDGVQYVGVVGKNSSHVEHLIDEIVVGDGSEPARFLLTASHDGETLEDALALAEIIDTSGGKGIQVVEV